MKNNNQEEALRALDWFKILDFIQGLATSQVGKEKIRHLVPFSSPEEALNHLKKVELTKAHFKEFLNSSHVFFRPTMASIDDYLQWIERLKKEAFLNPKELNKVRNFLEEARRLKYWLSSSYMSELKNVKSKILKTSNLFSLIDQLITEEGEIKTNASDLLFELYHKKNQIIQDIQKLLNRFIRDHNLQSLLQEKFVTTREGRWVLPVKSEMKTYFKGVVHARSQTYKTFFMEPQEVLELNNEVQRIQQQIDDEVSRLLKNVSQRLFEVRKDFKKTKDILLEYDLLLAFSVSSLIMKTKAFQFDTVFDLSDLKHSWLFLSELSQDSPLNIRDRGHYLEPEEIESEEIEVQEIETGGMKNRGFKRSQGVSQGKGFEKVRGRKLKKSDKVNRTQNQKRIFLKNQVVSNDLEMNKKKRILLLSGVNAGGKTVFLKAIGCAALMAKCGLPIAAREGSRIPFFQNIRILVHDLQDVEEQTSRFSSHLTELNRLTQFKGLSELFLIDEICASTDPEEGAALGKSFIENYAKQNVYAVVTSHLRSLQEGWSDSSGVFNGSFEFHETGPSYKFLPFQAGRSFALKLAQRVGVSLKILKRAQAFLSPKHRAYLKEYKKNETHYEDIKKLKKRWEDEVKRAKEKTKQYEDLQKSFENEKEKKLLQLLEGSRKKIETLIAEAKKEKIHLQIENLKKLKVSLPDVIKVKPSEKNLFPQSIEEFKKRFPPGSLVYVPSLRSEGTIQDVPNSKGEVTVLSHSMRLSLDWNQLKLHPDTFLKKPSLLSKYMSLSSKETSYSFQNSSKSKSFQTPPKKKSFSKSELKFLSSPLSGAALHSKKDRLKQSELIRILKKRKKIKLDQEKSRKKNKR